MSTWSRPPLCGEASREAAPMAAASRSYLLIGRILPLIATDVLVDVRFVQAGAAMAGTLTPPEPAADPDPG